MQCIPTYCNLELGSSRIPVGFRNLSAKEIVIPAKAIICQVHMVTLEEQLSTNTTQEEFGSWILDMLDLSGLRQWMEEQQ